MPIKGFLEAVEPFQVRGWVCDLACPEKPLTVEILLRGEAIGTILANLYRVDLEKDGIGTGDHAFIFNFAKRLADDDLNNVSARIVQQDGASEPLPILPEAARASPQPVFARTSHFQERKSDERVLLGTARSGMSAMKKPIILNGGPYCQGHDRLTAKRVLDLTGGNTGNLAFRYAIARSLVDVTFLPFDVAPDVVRRSGDIVVLPLANQLGAHTNLEEDAKQLQAIGLPILALGLGAQASSMEENVKLEPGTAEWLRTLRKLAPNDQPNIGVRGAYTKQQMGLFGLSEAAEIIGCPSNFITTDDQVFTELTQKFKERPKRIAVAAGIPYIGSLQSIERALAEMVTATEGAYIVQHDLEMISLACREFGRMDPAVLEDCRRYIAPNSSLDDFKRWCEKFAYVFCDVRWWMDFLRRFDFVVGTRFHGVMLAIQAGVPAGCIAHDSRTLELCRTTGIPVCEYREFPVGLSPQDLTDIFRFDLEAYLALRFELKSRYVNLVKSTGLQVAESFLKFHPF